MLILGKLAGIIILVLGAIFLVSTAALKKLISFWNQDKRYYGIGVIRVIMGIIIILAAGQAAQPAVAAVLGCLMLISGTFIFVVGEEKIKSIFAWYLDLPDLALRILGLITVTFGALIVLSL